MRKRNVQQLDSKYANDGVIETRIDVRTLATHLQWLEKVTGRVPRSRSELVRVGYQAFVDLLVKEKEIEPVTFTEHAIAVLARAFEKFEFSGRAHHLNLRRDTDRMSKLETTPENWREQTEEEDIKLRAALEMREVKFYNTQVLETLIKHKKATREELEMYEDIRTKSNS